MTSQSPPGAETIPPKEYVDAWSSIRILVEQGASWSGRERNHLFLNLGGLSFADASAVSRTNCIGDGRALATTDWDRDGRIDFFLKNRTAPRVQFFHNRGTRGNALLVSLRGVTCNRDAIGALVRVEAGGRTLRRRLYAGDGYLAQSSKTLHFGLGDATGVTRVTVDWPDGTRDEYADVAAGVRLWLVQGQPEPARVEPLAAGPLASVAPQQCRGASAPRPRVPLVEKLPLEPVRLPSFDAPERRVAALAGGPVLVNLWSLECAACMRELGELEEARARLDEAGLTFVPLTVDAQAEHARARERIAGFGFDAHAGYADAELMEVLRVLLTDVLGDFDVVPLPTSLLLDAAGQLVCLYPGPVPVDELLADVAALERMDATDLSDTQPFTHGLRLVDRDRPFRDLSVAFERLGDQQLARFYRKLGRKVRGR